LKIKTNHIDISIINPEEAFKIIGNDKIKPMAKEVKRILEEALSTI